MPSIAAENRKRIAEMLEQGMPSDQVAKKLRSRGVQLVTVLDVEKGLQAKNPKASPERTPVATINPGLMTRLAELCGNYGIDQVEATLEHVRVVAGLVSGRHTTAIDTPEHLDDEAAMSAAMANGHAPEVEASA